MDKDEVLDLIEKLTNEMKAQRRNFNLNGLRSSGTNCRTEKENRSLMKKQNVSFN